MEKAIKSLKELLRLLQEDIEEQEEICDFDRGYLFGVKVCIKRLENQDKKDLQEIKKLKETKKWIKQFRNLTKEEQEKVKKDRWRGRPM